MLRVTAARTTTMGNRVVNLICILVLRTNIKKFRFNFDFHLGLNGVQIQYCPKSGIVFLQAPVQIWLDLKFKF